MYAARRFYADCTNWDQTHSRGLENCRSRIAGSDADMWKRIFLLNGDLLLAAVDGFRGALDELEAAVRDGDGERLQELLAEAAQRRRNFDA